MDKGNSMQVYEFITSNSTEEKIESYTNVISRLKSCSLPFSDNKFFLYYTIQKLNKNILSVKDNFDIYLNSLNNVTTSEKNNYNNIFKSALDFLHNVYMKKINDKENEKIKFNIKTNRESESEVSITKLNKYTLSNQNKVYEILQLGVDERYNRKYNNIYEYKYIILEILLYDG